MQSEKTRDLVLAALEDIKAQELTVLDVRPLTDLADYMVLASGGTGRQVKALADNVLRQAKAGGVRPLGVEGLDEQEWVLIDLADVIVHVMQPKVRDFYELERLWSLAPAKPGGQTGGP